MPATAAELEAFIAQANGFETHYRHALTGMSYSEGVKHIANEAGAYWLIDLILIASKFEKLQEKCEGMEFWTLTTKGGKGEVICTDGGMDGGEAKVVFARTIPFTDFPLELIELYNDGGILCLPGAAVGFGSSTDSSMVGRRGVMIATATTDKEAESMNSEIVPALAHVIGQTRAVAVLRTAIDSYFYDRKKAADEIAFPHLLMTGPAGCGKTMLSETVARECGSTLHTELAQNLKTPEHIHGAAMMLEPGDIWFVDEIHELPPATQVALYRALEERKLFLGKKHIVNLPPFCLIGATTDEHLLTRSMRERFRIRLRLTHYTE